MWYAISVKNGKELEICERCKQEMSATFISDVFAPMKTISKKYQGTWKEEYKLMFPGFIFVECSRTRQELECLLAQNEYQELLEGNDNLIILVNEYDQQSLVKMMNANYLMETSLGYIVDGSLVVTQGPLQEKDHLVCKIDRHKRIAELNLDILGNNQHLLVGLEVVAKVTRAEYEVLLAEKECVSA